MSLWLLAGILGGWLLLIAGFLSLLYAHGERERRTVTPEPCQASYKERCPVCGTKNSMAANYCSSCGATFERGEQ